MEFSRKLLEEQQMQNLGYQDIDFQFRKLKSVVHDHSGLHLH